MIFRLFIVSLFLCSAAAIAKEGLPTEPRALFNHGAELAALGKLDEAVEVLRQAAVVREQTVAAKALSLLGQIAAVSAKQAVAENPAETLPEQRQTIFDHLQSAERSFAESLSLQPNEEVRQYLETLRAWRYNMTNVWEEYDREQRRNAELQQRIRWLADWEEKLTEKVRHISEEPNSPRKFQTGYEAGREQKQLAEELTMFQEIPVSDEELAEKWEQLPEIQKIADEATELLTKHRTEEALPKQQQILDYLRTLLKQEQSQQNQQNHEQSDQEQQEQNQDQNQQQQEQQNQQSQQEGEAEENGEQESEMNQPQSTRQEGETAQKEESPQEKAERLLIQVRRKEQAARELREQLRALLMQAESVEKDW
jgi:hypothetical protein